MEQILLELGYTYVCMAAGVIIYHFTIVTSLYTKKENK